MPVEIEGVDERGGVREIDGVELEKRREGDRRSGGRSTVREESSKR